MKRGKTRGLDADEARKYAEEGGAAYKDLTNREKRAAAVYLAKSLFKSSLALYLGNWILQMIRGRKATYDPVGELGEFLLGDDPIDYVYNKAMQALGKENDFDRRKEEYYEMTLEELSKAGEDETFWNDLLQLAQGLFEELPVINNFAEESNRPAMLTPVKGFDSIKDFLEGFRENDERWMDYLDVIGYLQPFGAYGQIRKSAKGIAALAKGGTGMDSGGKLRYAAADGNKAEQILEGMKNVFFGDSATDQAKDYYEDGFKEILTDRETQGYRGLANADIGMDRNEYLEIAAVMGSLEDDDLSVNEVMKEKLRYLLSNYPDQAEYLTEYLVIEGEEKERFENLRLNGIGAVDYVSIITAEKKDAKKTVAILEKITDKEKRDAVAYEIMPDTSWERFDKNKHLGISAFDVYSVDAAAEGKENDREKRAARLKAISGLDLDMKKKVQMARIYDSSATETDLKYPDVLDKYAEIAGDTTITEDKDRAAKFFDYLTEQGISETDKSIIMNRFTYGGASAANAEKTSAQNAENEKYDLSQEELTYANNTLQNLTDTKEKVKAVQGMKLTGKQKFGVLKSNVLNTQKKAAAYEIAEAVGIDYDDFAEHFAAAEEYYGDESGLRRYLEDQDIDSNTETVIYMLVTEKDKRFNSAMKDLLKKTGWSESAQEEFYEEHKYKNG